MHEHPSRAIVIRLRDRGERGLEARVFAQCWMPFGQRPADLLRADRDHRVATRALPDVPAVVLPLVVADLPVILWCRSGRAPDLEGFRDLEVLAQKVIFDSASFPDHEKALAKLLTASLPGTRVADLAWGRLTRSRELIAQAVNNEDLLRSLSTVDVVRVHARGPKPEIPALYFAAWLANRLALVGAFPKIEWDYSPKDVPTSLRGSRSRVPMGFHFRPR